MSRLSLNAVFVFSVVVFSLALLLGGFSTPALAADALPLYRLQVGQELQYSGHSEFKYQGGGHNYENTWRVWVARQNADGGWRLVLRSGMTFRPSNAPAAYKPEERVNFAWCDMSPSGQIAENDTLGTVYFDIYFEERGIARLPDIDPEHVVPNLDITADDAEKVFLQCR